MLPQSLLKLMLEMRLKRREKQSLMLTRQGSLSSVWLRERMTLLSKELMVMSLMILRNKSTLKIAIFKTNLTPQRKQRVAKMLTLMTSKVLMMIMMELI